MLLYSNEPLHYYICYLIVSLLNLYCILCIIQILLHDTIIGVCTNDVDQNSAPLMILEYMPYGDLQSFLQTYKYICTVVDGNSLHHIVFVIVYRPTQEEPSALITEDHFFSFAIDVCILQHCMCW